MKAELVLAFSESGKRYALDVKDVCRIGRTPENSIQVSTENVSRNHAIVQANNAGVFFLYDLGSRNGTLVNGCRITRPVALRNGDVISIGGLELQFVQSGKLEESSERVSYPPETMFYRSIDEITVVVTDVRGYTRLCQEIGEARVAEIVHAFNSDAGTVLAGLNVWGVKHIGDAVMAIWVHRGSRTASLVAALRGISELLEIAETLQSRFGLASPVLLGAAVNTGVASIGNMGSIAAADYTALGDVVNKVFRLEAATRELQADVVISSEVCDALLPEMDLRNSTTAHRVQLKGYTEPTLVYVMSRSALHKELEDLGTRFVPAPPKSA